MAAKEEKIEIRKKPFDPKIITEFDKIFKMFVEDMTPHELFAYIPLLSSLMILNGIEYMSLLLEEELEDEAVTELAGIACSALTPAHILEEWKALNRLSGERTAIKDA